jgi:exosortase
MKRTIKYLPWALIALLYFPTFKALYQSRWEYIDYTHAYFTLPLSLWLVWKKRAELNSLLTASNVKKGFGYLALLFFGLFTFYFGWQHDYLMISTLSLLPVLFGLSGYLYGTQIVKAISFPLLYLLFLVPPPLGILDSITLPMRYGASVATHQILALLHYPIERSGLLLYMGGHEIFVGAPCSGFRSLITMLALGAVYIYLAKGSMVKKTILTVSIIPLALIGNVVRIVTLCLITYHLGKEAGEGFMHYFSGAVIFLIALAGLMGLESLLERKTKT